MHARVTTLSGVSPDRREQAIAQFQNTVVPWVKEQGGRGAIMLVDRASGNGIGITLWDDEAAMRASEEAASELRRQAADEAGATEQPRVDEYEVAVFETS